MTNQFGDGSSILLQIQNAVDAAGNPAQFETPPVWLSSDPTIFNPTASADGLSATGAALKTGTVTITATSGNASGAIALTITAGQVVSFEIVASLVPAPAAAPAAPAAQAPAGS